MFQCEFPSWMKKSDLSVSVYKIFLSLASVYTIWDERKKGSEESRIAKPKEKCISVNILKKADYHSFTVTKCDTRSNPYISLKWWLLYEQHIVQCLQNSTGFHEPQRIRIKHSNGRMCRTFNGLIDWVCSLCFHVALLEESWLWRDSEINIQNEPFFKDMALKVLSFPK